MTLRKWVISRCQSAFLANGMPGLIGPRPRSAGASFLNLRVLCPKGHGVPEFSGAKVMSLILIACIATGSTLAIPVIATKRRIFG